jgi:hypothetical protein
MKKYIYAAIGALILGLVLFLCMEINRTKEYRTLYEKELQNVEAYKASNSGLEGEIKQYKMTITDLEMSKDTLDIKLFNTLQDLKIARDKISSLQYQLKKASRVDTIVVPDTILIKGTDIDTTIGDAWYNINLQLQYPSTIITKPTFNSEQYVYIYNKKEYVGGKSKWFFINWFKKKYISTEVKVEEKNPYINTIEQKFIKIENNE